MYTGVRSRRFCYARSANLVYRKKEEKKTNDNDGWRMKTVETCRESQGQTCIDIARELMQVRERRLFS